MAKIIVSIIGYRHQFKLMYCNDRERKREWREREKEEVKKREVGREQAVDKKDEGPRIIRVPKVSSPCDGEHNLCKNVKG